MGNYSEKYAPLNTNTVAEKYAPLNANTVAAVKLYSTIKNTELKKVVKREIINKSFTRLYGEE